MSEFERRLAGLRPDRIGLSAEAMLFAAGLAEGRRGRSAWTAGCGALTAVAIGLGVWGAAERGEREGITTRLTTPAVSTMKVQGLADEQTPSSLPPNGLFALRRSVEKDPERWLAMSEAPHSNPAASPPQEPPIMKAGNPERVIVQ